MSLDDAAQLFNLEQAVRQRAACGLWVDHSLHNVTLETPFYRDYGRDSLITRALDVPLLLSGVEFSDVWSVTGAGGHVAWSANAKGTHTGRSATFGAAEGGTIHGLYGGAARLTGGRVADLYWFDDTLALTRRAEADPQAVATALRVAEVPPLGLDPVMDQRPADMAALLTGAPEWLVIWLSLLTQRRFDLAEIVYAPQSTLTLTAGRVVAGTGPVARHWLALTQALPGFRLWPEKWMVDGAGAALLWRLSAIGPAGPVRNVPVLSMWHLDAGRISAERLLLDEIALLTP